MALRTGKQRLKAWRPPALRLLLNGVQLRGLLWMTRPAASKAFSASAELHPRHKGCQYSGM